MSNFFSRFGIDTNDPKMQRASLYSKFNAARMNILLIVVFSVINIFTLILGKGGFFLFTGAIPYQVVDLGMALCGFKPQEYYTNLGVEPIFDKSFFAVFVAIAALVLTLFVLCWAFSKKRGDVWLKIALALVSADTMVMLLGGNFSTMLLDAVFHIWLIVILFMGISAYEKLRKMPKDLDFVEEGVADPNYYPESGEGTNEEDY